MSSAKQTSIKKNFFLSTLYEILCVIVPFITAPYASRVLGAANIGIYSYTNSILMYFSLFALLGTATYGKREISRTREDKNVNSKLFWEIEILSIFTSLIAIVGWGIFILFTSEYKLYYLILTLTLLSKMFDISWFYKGLEEFKYTVTRSSVVKILGVVCLFCFVKTEKDLWIYFLFHTGIDLFGNISMWIPLKKFLVKVNPKTFTYKNHLKSTLVYFIPTIATSIYTVLDKTLIGLITKSPEENGYYEQATKIISIVKTLAFLSLNAVVGVRSSYLFEQNKTQEIKDKISQTINFNLLMSFGCCAGLIGVASNFVPLFYGPGYENVIPILMLLSPVLLITGISTCLNDLYFTPSGQIKKSAKYVIIGAVTNLVFNVLLIPKFKGIGAVLGTLIAESIIMILYICFCKGFLTFSTVFKHSWKKIIAAAVMFVYLIFVKKYFSNAFILLLVQICGGVFIYFALLLLLRDSAIRFIFSWINSKIKKIKNE